MSPSSTAGPTVTMSACPSWPRIWFAAGSTSSRPVAASSQQRPRARPPRHSNRLPGGPRPPPSHLAARRQRHRRKHHDARPPYQASGSVPGAGARPHDCALAQPVEPADRRHRTVQDLPATCSRGSHRPGSGKRFRRSPSASLCSPRERRSALYDELQVHRFAGMEMPGAGGLSVAAIRLGRWADELRHRSDRRVQLDGTICRQSPATEERGCSTRRCRHTGYRAAGSSTAGQSTGCEHTRPDHPGEHSRPGPVDLPSPPVTQISDRGGQIPSRSTSHALRWHPLRRHSERFGVAASRVVAAEASPPRRLITMGELGQFKVNRVVAAVGCGVAVNPAG